MAIDIDSTSMYLRGTRGATLIEQGHFAAGIATLEETADLSHVNSHTVVASLYLALAYQKQGKAAKARKYRQFALENESAFDPDEKILYDRIML